MNILNKLTKKSLIMNKKRTLFTAIGIILTSAMISGVTTLAVSFQSFLVNAERETAGDWEISYQNVQYENKKVLEESDQFEDIFITKKIENVSIDRFLGEYSALKEYSKKAFDNFKVEIVKGRLPKQNNEMIISENLFKRLENFNVGDKIKVNFENGQKEYTVVGISKYTSSDYITLLDEKNIKENDIVNITTKAKKVKDIIERGKKIAQDNNFYKNEDDFINGFETNQAMLMYQGECEDTTFLKTLYTVCGVLIAVISIGAIVVIYNSFAISVSERVKQFGILASVGATKKQIRRMVIYEGIILGTISIFVGILFGILGIAVTLKIVDGLITKMLVEDIGVHLTLNVSIISLIIAVILIAITILISVLVPAIRASKISPIEAIRGNREIKVNAKKLRTFKVLRKVYGIEGDLALKNLKRSKKRYRTTVISLVISIVLFLTFNGFVGYMFQGFDALYRTIESDYTITVYEKDSEEGINTHKIYKEEMDNVYTEVKKIEDVTRITKVDMIDATVKLTNDNMDNSLKRVIEKNESVKKAYGLDKNTESNMQAIVLLVDTEELNRYLKECGLENLLDNQCILMNHVNGIVAAKAEFNIFNYKTNDNISVNVYGNEETTNLQIAEITEKAPFEVPDTTGCPILIVNDNKFEEMYSKVLEDKNIKNDEYTVSKTDFYIKSNDTKKIEEKVPDILSGLSMTDGYSYMDVDTQISTIKNLKLIIEIFLYGFIVLISLIGISNIFNTITTNINLRRREFAVLKSVGMTDKSFIKMLDLECVFYGTKALLFGLPIGVGLCYILTKLFEESIMIMFRIPWISILICIVVVYMIVFITMKYATSKVKKDNIIDVLRDDNI